MTNEIEVVKVPIPAGSNFEDVVKSVSGTGVVTVISVTDTPYACLLLNGYAQPFIHDSEKHELWSIQGLDKMFSRCLWISPRQKKMTFGGVERLYDTDLFWTFDFSSPTRGMAVSFSADGGW